MQVKVLGSEYKGLVAVAAVVRLCWIRKAMCWRWPVALAGKPVHGMHLGKMWMRCRRRMVVMAVACKELMEGPRLATAMRPAAVAEGRLSLVPLVALTADMTQASQAVATTAVTAAASPSHAR